MNHKPEIVQGSLKRNSVTGGVEFQMTCCGELPESVHIQNLAAFESHEQRLQVIQQYLDEHQAKHEKEIATAEFMEHFLAGDLTECPGCR